MIRLVRSLMPVVLALTLLAFLAATIDLGAVWRQLARLEAPWLAAAAASMLASVVVASFRYQVILAVLIGRRPGLAPLVQLNLLTLFAAHVLPFGAMADGLRAFVSWSLLAIRPAAAVEGVIADRALALAGFAALGLVVIPIQMKAGWQEGLILVQFAAFALIVLAFAVVQLAARRLSVGQRWPLVARIAGALERVTGFVSSFGGLAFQLGIAAASIGLFALMLVLLSRGLGLSLSPVSALAVAPALYLSQVIPIFYVGFGSREITMVALMAAGGVMGETDAVALSLAVGLCNFLVSLAGAVFAWPFLRDMRWRHAARLPLDEGKAG